MKTIKQVDVEPVFVEFIPRELEEGKLYISKEYGTAVHNCLCGCGSKTITPLSGEYKWVLTEKGDKVSLSPSVGNFNFPCKSHYIITNNKANFV
jgi:hypothetical protein